MSQTLSDSLHLDRAPVGIYFANETIVCDLNASPERRNCVIPLLLASADGQIVSMNEKSCNCPGGAVGCCFGDGFARLRPDIHKMLSQGYGEEAPPHLAPRMKEGERFFVMRRLIGGERPCRFPKGLSAHCICVVEQVGDLRHAGRVSVCNRTRSPHW